MTLENTHDFPYFQSQAHNSMTQLDLPHYLTPDGILDISAAWTPLESQLASENMTARQRLNIGGMRSGKTAGALMDGVTHGLLRYPKSNMLVLRKTFPELKAGPIEDFRKHCPAELYTYHATDHVATFTNGSRLVFGHCKNGKEEDVQQYLGTAYPWIVVDECAQFAPDAWELLLARNAVNPECMPDKLQPCGGCGKPYECGYPCMPKPWMVGCTNPFGPHYDWYYSMFVKKEPYTAPDGARRDLDGYYWITKPNQEPVLVYNPNNYQYIHSTVLGNRPFLDANPDYIESFNNMSPAKRDKYLLGYMEGSTGQYFECFTDENLFNLRSDPTGIIWQPWQPIWGGWDWALGSHWNCCYFFTKALVRVRTIEERAEGKAFSTDYKTKTVCFKEYVTQDKLDREMAHWISTTLKYPNGEPCKPPTAIYFSHEKFNRQVEEHSPADQLTQQLVAHGITCGVTPATRNRIGRASLMYQMIAHRELVILDTCQEVIRAIPNLMRDTDNLDDVFKPQGANKADDCYDGFSLGLYGYFNQQEVPAQVREQKRLDQMDLLNRHFQKWGNTVRRQRLAEAPRHTQTWQRRLKP